MSPAARNKVVPYLLIAVAVIAGWAAIAEFRSRLYYPSVKVRAQEGMEIAFLFGGRTDRARCEALAANVGDSVLAVCPACKIAEKTCLVTLEPQQQKALSTEPLDLPSARLADGGVTTYRSPSADMALGACRESERQASLRVGPGRVICYPPNAARPYSSLQKQRLGESNNALGLLFLALGGIAFGLAIYLMIRYEELRAYLSALPRSAKRLLMLGMDIALIPAALVIALALEHGAQWPQVEGLGLTLALALLVAIPIFIKLGLYSAVIRYMEFRMSLTIVVSVTIAALLFAGVVDLLGISTLTVQDAVTYWMLALLGIGGSRVIARQYLRQSSASSAVPDPVIIYGAGDAGAQLAISLKSNPAVILVAFVDDKPDLTGSFLYGIRIHPAARLPALVKELGVRQVLLAMPSASKAQKREVFDRIEHVGVRIRTIPRLSALLDGRARISDIEDISIEELVGRDPVPPISALLARCIERKAVLVTGAGGSIGAELCRQILALAPKKLVLLDLSEYALYAIHEELAALKGKFAYSAEIVPVLGSVSRSHLVRRVLAEHGVNTIYHAAAYKHVPLLESNPLAGIRNNVIGSLRVAEAALAENVETFVLVSTDKAVRPANIMGASKRMAELVMQAIDGSGRTRFCMVRFGNVLDSSGSVVPLFRKQIHEGGPVTVTHPEITRYFMTIPEAAQLVLQAGAMAKGGDVFALDMGSPVKILDLARRMIRLSGFAVRDEEHPNGDIEIRFTGLRTGDKLYEELLIDNKASATEHPLIMRAMEESIPWAKLKPTLDSLEEAIGRLDEAKVVAILLSVVPLSSPTEPLDAAAADTGNRRSPPLKLVT